MEKFKKGCLILLLFFNGFDVHASEATLTLWNSQKLFDNEFPTSDNIQWSKGRSLYPNEFNLIENAHVWKNANDIQSKAYISVGSERSFMGAGLTRSKYLIGIDFDPDIVKFNRINAVLLGVSISRMDYVMLRFSRDFNALKRRIEKASVKFEISEADWNWWIDIHKDGKWKHLIFDSIDKVGYVGQFQKLAYWNHQASWEHLRNLVLTQRVGFFAIDITDTKKLNYLNTILTQLKIKPGVFDSSNVLAYVGGRAMAQAIQILGRLVEPQDMLSWINTSLSLENRLSPYTGIDTLEYIWRFEKMDFSALELGSLGQLERMITLRIIANNKNLPFCRKTHLDPM